MHIYNVIVRICQKMSGSTFVYKFFVLLFALCLYIFFSDRDPYFYRCAVDIGCP